MAGMCKRHGRAQVRDSPLSGGVRLSSLKHDCDRRTTSTAGRCPGESTRSVGTWLAAGSYRQIMTPGPRLISAVCRPSRAAGATSLSKPVTDIQCLGRAARRYLDHLLEEPRIRLGGPPIIGSSDHVGGQVKAAQDAARTGRLVPGDADPKPSSRSWASAARTSRYRSSSPNHSGLPPPPAAGEPCPGRIPAGRPGKSPGSPDRGQ